MPSRGSPKGGRVPQGARGCTSLPAPTEDWFYPISPAHKRKAKLRQRARAVGTAGPDPGHRVSPPCRAHPRPPAAAQLPAREQRGCSGGSHSSSSFPRVPVGLMCLWSERPSAFTAQGTVWPGLGALPVQAAAQTCHRPHQGTLRWENSSKSAPLRSPAGQLSVTQHSRPRAISRGTCPLPRPAGAPVTTLHPGSDEGSPAQPQPGREGTPAQTPPGTLPRAPRRIPRPDAGLMRRFVRFPTPPHRIQRRQFPSSRNVTLQGPSVMTQRFEWKRRL